MIKFEVNKQISAKFLNMMKSAPEKTGKAMGIALRRCGDQLRNDAGINAPYKTGNLRRSITMDVISDRKVIVGSNLEYARIHDEGGTIYPKNGKYLRFQIGGQWVTVKKVTIPKYRGQGYLTPAYKKLVSGDAEKIFRDEISRVIN